MDALTHLTQADFPGNVRQLENVLARAAALADTDEIQIDDLEIIASASTIADATTLDPSNGNRLNSTATPADSQNMTSLDAVAGDLEGHMDAIEREILQNAMTEYRWNKTAAAKALGVSFRSLRYRLKKLGLDD